jgi:predicted ATPase/class 3 adenylate cyclase
LNVDDNTIDIPEGIVAVLFTDVEGSTRLWAADVERTSRSFLQHDSIVRNAIESNDGYVFGTAGDSFRGAFSNPQKAVDAAIDIQQRLAEAQWGDDPVLKVRIGLHSGRVTSRNGDYFGPVPNTASRIEALGHGGQILMTDAVRTAVETRTTWLGEHRLRDVAEPMAIHQVGTDPFPPLRVIDPSLSTLPNAGAPIIGRDREMNQVRGLIDNAALITLTGIGGCGKTKLALEIAYQELPGRPGGCYFADLSAVADGAELPAALARAVRLTTSGSDTLGQVVDHLAPRSALLIMDNCEHIVDECAGFAELLMARSSSTVLLATSRQRLDVPGEHAIAVPPLAQDESGAAVQLFMERATEANPNAELDDSTRPVIAEICENLDGMPLAIELAAARVAIMPPKEILARMEDRFRLLSGGRGRNKRRTLQATLDWSYDLLDEDEQDFFRRCGTFVGSFDLPAAIALSGADEYLAMDLLESLVKKSLISSEENDGITRFRLLETVRIYAGEQLDRSDSVAEARDMHLDHYHGLVSTPSWSEACDLDRSFTLSSEWSNVASALEWAAANNDWARASEIAFGCQGMWETQITATEGHRWLNQIVPNMPEELLEATEGLRFTHASLAMQLDDFDFARATYEQVIATESPTQQAQSLAIMAFVVNRQGIEQSNALLAQTNEVIDANEVGPEARCSALWTSGILKQYSADFEGAEADYAAAHSHSLQIGARVSHVIFTGLSLAASQILVDNPAAALDTLDSQEWSKSIWDSSPIVRSLALIDLDRVPEAAELVISYGQQALLGRLSRMANDALVGLAALAIHRGESKHAWTLLQQATVPRSPATIGLAEGLADRIDRGEELRSLHRNRLVPLATLDATAALQDELVRLSSERAA